VAGRLQIQISVFTQAAALLRRTVLEDAGLGEQIEYMAACHRMQRTSTVAVILLFPAVILLFRRR
jgi:hypothetical protein